MSLRKAIEHGKERRLPYYRSARFDKTCRPGGSCPYCKGNRSHKTRKRLAACRDQLRELDGNTACMPYRVMQPCGMDKEVETMADNKPKCRKCETAYDEAAMSSWFASKGGKASRRVLTTEQARAMNQAKANKRKGGAR